MKVLAGTHAPCVDSNDRECLRTGYMPSSKGEANSKVVETCLSR